LNVVIPANTSAKVYLPHESGAKVLESGKPIKVTESDGSDVIEVGSGTYQFQVQ